MDTVQRSRQKLDRSKIARRVTAGGNAAVYEAEDTVKGRGVAWKIPDATRMLCKREFGARKKAAHGG